MTIDTPTRVPVEVPAHVKTEADAEVKSLTIPIPETVKVYQPQPGMREVKCHKCGDVFNTEVATFEGRELFATVCDICAEREKQERGKVVPETYVESRNRVWTSMVGTRYAHFDASLLPGGIRQHVQRVMAWTPSPKGIGLVGPPRSGKSPLLYALGRKLYVSGADVFPTSGIGLQRAYSFAFSDRDRSVWEKFRARCEDCAVLLIDDADKMNFTGGVESEYYGILETRRNWLRPVLCTMNLVGKEIAELGKDRGDRAQAIVERLRDLSEFIAVS